MVYFNVKVISYSRKYWGELNLADWQFWKQTAKLKYANI